MLFLIQDCLIKMRNTPSLRNIILKQLHQFLRSLSCDIVSPGTERNQKLAVFIKRHVSVHHGADTKRAHAGKLFAILFFYILGKSPVAALKSCMNILQMIGPDSVFQTVLPVIAS